MIPDSTQESAQDRAVRAERTFNATPREIFAAFEDAQILAQWWGPAGFTNTFDHFDFTPGGHWRFVMHGPTGANYQNESIFREIVPHSRIVIEHIVKPWYLLTITLTPHDGGTHVAWVQEFESAKLAEQMRPLSATANQENLDKLQSALQQMRA